jgi:hypothetical protein
LVFLYRSRLCGIPDPCQDVAGLTVPNFLCLGRSQRLHLKSFAAGVYGNQLNDPESCVGAGQP